MKRISNSYGLRIDHTASIDLFNVAIFRFGDVREISAVDYVAEVNKAGEAIYVVLHLYKQGIPLCALINQHMTALASKFPTVKVARSGIKIITIKWGVLRGPIVYKYPHD